MFFVTDALFVGTPSFSGDGNHIQLSGLKTVQAQNAYTFCNGVGYHSSLRGRFVFF